MSTIRPQHVSRVLAQAGQRPVASPLREGIRVKRGPRYEYAIVVVDHDSLSESIRRATDVAIVLSDYGYRIERTSRTSMRVYQPVDHTKGSTDA